MPRFSRLKVLNSMQELGLIPVFYTPQIDVAKGVVKSCAQAGALCVELTNRGDGAVDVFKELEKYACSEHPEIILGVGSVVDAPTAAMYIASGANFIVGPVLDRETAVLCNKRKVPYMPGCGSATEIHEAEALGVEICKIFPATQIGGPAFVKAVKAPCPWTSIMPTGGVNPTRESLGAWFEAGITCAAIGSKLITKEILKNKDFATLTNRIKEVLQIIKQVKKYE
jgi:2-dehydro-3-deoxyphosphogluconate aldolase/(4S)-4-hydroxy-2-oxoglutarate aldolase